MGGAKAAKAARREAREQAEQTMFWHGGIRGLQVGEFILPPAETLSWLRVSEVMAEARADRVYITTDREVARVFAAITTDGIGSSRLYRVQPVGDYRPDPDNLTCSFEARRALIVTVEETTEQLNAFGYEYLNTHQLRELARLANGHGQGGTR